MPEREDDHLTPATRLLEKRREMSEVEQALAAQKEVCDSLYKCQIIWISAIIKAYMHKIIELSLRCSFIF